MKSNDTEQRREFEELVNRYEEPLFRFAFFRLGSRMDAEDVVQEAFLKYLSRGGGPVTTVKSRFSCGIEKLKRLLNPEKPKRQ